MNAEAFAAFYDRFFGDFLEDLPFYQGYAERAGSPLLEVGCGTGRLAVPLAVAGFRLVGLDISLAMLDRARERAAAAGVADRIRWVQGDATQGVPEGPYPMAFIPLNTFLHFHTLEAQRAVLAHLHRALEPGGLLLLDCLNPDAGLLQESGQVHLRMWQEDPESGGMLLWFEARRVDAAAQRLEVVLLVEERQPDGPPDSVDDELERHPLEAERADRAGGGGAGPSRTSCALSGRGSCGCCWRTPGSPWRPCLAPTISARSGRTARRSWRWHGVYEACKGISLPLKRDDGRHRLLRLADL